MTEEDSVLGAIVTRSIADPGAPAFWVDGATVTLDMVVAGARVVAGRLAAAGVRRGDRVLVLEDPDVAGATAILGAWVLGACAVPLDPAAADVEVERAREWVGARCTWRRGEVVRPVPGAVEADAEVPPVAAIDDLAILFLTSGSTGSPKAVAHRHDSLAAFSRMAADLDLRPTDRVAALSPLRFDISLLEVVVPLVVGATVAVVPRSALLFPADLLRTTSDAGVTFWQSVPSRWHRIQTARATSGQSPLPPLRRCLLTGERASPATVRQLMDDFPTCRVADVYGLTEANDVTLHEHSSPPLDPTPLGRPLPGVELRIRTADGELVRSGRGELCVRTPTSMVGYWGDPDRTEVAFVAADPDGFGSGSRYLRTGDLVEGDDLDSLRLLGRTDRRAKVAGRWLDLDAVEVDLADAIGARSLAVDVVESAAGDLVLAALVEGPADDRLGALDRLLPRHARPALVRWVPELPRTPAGKFDRPSIRRALEP